MRILPLSLLATTLLFSLYGTVHAQSSTSQQICHNGQCWDIGGDIGDECCPFFSDERLKSNVQRLENPTENLLKLHGVTFNWKQNDQADVGLIAQDVQKVYPQLVRTDRGHLQVDYQKLVAPLIESVRELNARVVTLETALADK
ncbi:hypothetical protein PSJE_02410 [Pseudomonas jessenii]|jgi:hypothetical protein|uniref:Chaperone of endosialidase n=2 Tax=Pseudomonas TaxID=286 RepID=A0A231GR57_PSEJE|nr:MULTISPECIES: tail fiber domain-containing protein [Pseudomonas]OXR39083.1 hypothetical protein PSJE_02410 [Pseudomonas jessenii]SEC36980.1 Chaperone of endosialidase [Pseudomonas jessenii]VVP67300.1 hypothetical protein PS922_00077 [Pseudomonas fluorescens]